jgi:hypothetical protein
LVFIIIWVQVRILKGLIELGIEFEGIVFWDWCCGLGFVFRFGKIGLGMGRSKGLERVDKCLSLKVRIKFCLGISGWNLFFLELFHGLGFVGIYRFSDF